MANYIKKYRNPTVLSHRIENEMNSALEEYALKYRISKTELINNILNYFLTQGLETQAKMSDIL